MPLPDRLRSRAILIGTGTYQDEHLPDLPSVTNNLTDLKAVLTDPHTGAFGARHCTIIENPVDPRTAATSLADIAASADDVLLIYYAGHGIVGARRHELYLGTTTSELDRPHYSAWPFAWMRDELLDSRAATKVLILDCCFSGLAIDDFMADQESLVLGQIGVSGTYTLTSTSASTAALAPIGARHTAFSGELLTLLRDGVPAGPAELDLHFLYHQLLGRMTAKGWPTPKQRGTDNVHDLALGRNPGNRVGLFVDRAAAQDVGPEPAHQASDPFGHATDQLGSDKAAVRMSGLYWLERLAQDEPERRQTAMNVICGYLRMPFTPTSTRPTPGEDQAARDRHERWLEEREVRTLAQRILEGHLYPHRHSGDHYHHFQDTVPTFWDNIHLDLSSANLIDFTLAHCRFDKALFIDTEFNGIADFSDIRIRGASFDGARFKGDADFSSSKLGSCTFTQATFDSLATFSQAELDQPDFKDVEFSEIAKFYRTSFRWGASFNRAKFRGAAEFRAAQFGTPQGSESEPVDTSFAHATFAMGADFQNARFIHGVDATGATFPEGGQPAGFGPVVRQVHPGDTGQSMPEPAGLRRRVRRAR
jgi:uncharacterized protein YjbI with pentapeptide repeats